MSQKNIKILLLGDSGVGKSFFLNKLTHFSLDNPISETIGIDFRFLPLSNAKCIIWDTSGKECFRPIIKAYSLNTQIAIFVFDVENKASFLNFEGWISFLQPTSSNEVPTRIVPIMVILESEKKKSKRMVTEECARQFAQKNHCFYYKMRAFNEQNLHHLINLLPPSFRVRRKLHFKEEPYEKELRPGRGAKSPPPTQCLNTKNSRCFQNMIIRF